MTNKYADYNMLFHLKLSDFIGRKPVSPLNPEDFKRLLQEVLRTVSVFVIHKAGLRLVTLPCNSSDSLPVLTALEKAQSHLNRLKIVRLVWQFEKHLKLTKK